MDFPIQREKNTFQKFPCSSLTICAPMKIKKSWKCSQPSLQIGLSYFNINPLY